MSLPTRALGCSGLRTAPLVLGGNVFGWTVDERTGFSLLDAWVDAGFNMIDTADVYSVWVHGHLGGESEALIGRWLKRGGRRDRVLIASKVGKTMGDGSRGLGAAHIRASVEASLRRLQTDCIDLYQSHEDDAGMPLQETLSIYADLIRAGKLRAIGASNHSPARLAEGLQLSATQGLPRYETVQPGYNLYDRQAFEQDLAPLCREQGLGVLGFYGLAMGFLSGKYRSAADVDKSPRGHRAIASYLNPRGLRILAALDEVAARHQATPAQVAVAWLLSQPDLTAPIISASSLQQLQELIAATRLALTAQDAILLAKASAYSTAPKTRNTEPDKEQRHDTT